METTGGRRHAYTLDNAWEQARERLGLLEAVLDPGTIRHLLRLGVSAGWHCLEVGAGGGSIVEWLCDRVGTTGHVLATDIDTRFLDALDHPNLEILQHNVVTDPLPEAAFDLIHVRTVLTHLAGREQALDRIVSALKPGGWLLVEEGDFITWVPDPTISAADIHEKGWAAAYQVFTAGGADFYYGRRLYGEVCATGLADVGAEGWVPMIRGGTPLARFWRLTFTQLRSHMVGTGLLTEEEMEHYLALYDDPTFVGMGNIIMAVWGRRA